MQPPYRFTRPKGGAGPRIRAECRTPTHANGGPGPGDDPSYPSNTIPNPLNLSQDALAALTLTVLGVIQQKKEVPKKVRQPVSKNVKERVVRESDPRRKNLAVRQFDDRKPPMN